MFIRPSTGRITSTYGRRKHPVTGELGKMHWGIDFGRDGSDKIVAAADGVVTLSRVNGGFGNCIYIEHIINGKVYNTVYAHLSKILAPLHKTVKQGEVIGIMGSTGVSTGVHLHFEVTIGKWNSKYTTNINPLHYIVDPEVKALQVLLVKAGYKLTVDGISGKETDAAVISFQKKHGLTTDGIAGKATLAKLEEVTTVVKPVTPPTPKTRYTDVPKTHSAYEALERLSEAGIIGGYEDSTYRPNDVVTRAQMALVVDKALQSLKG